MITPNRLARCAEQGAFDRIIEDISRGGRPMPLPVRLRLSEPESRAGAAIGLALARSLELSRGCCPSTRRLASMLIERQATSGAFGSHAATAVATGALLALLDRLARDPRDPARELASRAEAAAMAGLHHLHAAQGWATVEDPAGPLIGDEIDAAIVLWALAGREPFHVAVRVDDLYDALADCGALTRRDIRDLLALAPATPSAPPTLGVAA